MTQFQLDGAVALATGESLRHVHRRGFSLLARGPGDLEPEDLRLALDCPFCGITVPYPGVAGGGKPALAECPRCDVDFDFDPAEVYAAGIGAA